VAAIQSHVLQFLLVKPWSNSLAGDAHPHQQPIRGLSDPDEREVEIRTYEECQFGECSGDRFEAIPSR